LAPPWLLDAESSVSELKAFRTRWRYRSVGTDVGFTELYDTSLEYELMHRRTQRASGAGVADDESGANFKAAKVERGFGRRSRVCDGDPIADVGNLARVAYTIRAGRIIYQKP